MAIGHTFGSFDLGVIVSMADDAVLFLLNKLF